jgi:nicotinamide riboside transporter PnuC
MADDFCSAATAQSRGIIAGAAYWYLNWTGRFSANLLDSFFGYLGPAATPYATGLVLILWLAVLTYAGMQDSGYFNSGSRYVCHFQQQQSSYS